MSLPTRSPIQIYINWGDLQGTDTIKDAIHNIMKSSLKLAVKNTLTLMDEVVPDSSPRVLSGGYGKTYRSENLSQTAQNILQNSFLAIGNTLQKQYTLKYGYPASYAQFVDRMRGVRWSTAGTHGGFIKEVRDFLIAEVKRLIDIGLNSARANKLNATKYIGTEKYKKQVGGVKASSGPSPSDNAVWSNTP